MRQQHPEQASLVPLNKDPETIGRKPRSKPPPSGTPSALKNEQADKSSSQKKAPRNGPISGTDPQKAGTKGVDQQPKGSQEEQKKGGKGTPKDDKKEQDKQPKNSQEEQRKDATKKQYTDIVNEPPKDDQKNSDSSSAAIAKPAIGTQDKSRVKCATSVKVVKTPSDSSRAAGQSTDPAKSEFIPSVSDDEIYGVSSPPSPSEIGNTVSGSSPSAEQLPCKPPGSEPSLAVAEDDEMENLAKRFADDLLAECGADNDTTKDMTSSEVEGEKDSQADDKNAKFTGKIKTGAKNRDEAHKNDVYDDKCDS